MEKMHSNERRAARACLTALSLSLRTEGLPTLCLSTQPHVGGRAYRYDGGSVPAVRRHHVFVTRPKLLFCLPSSACHCDPARVGGGD
jgi:hypothetical protein